MWIRLSDSLQPFAVLFWSLLPQFPGCFTLQGTELDGHKLLIQLSQRKRLPEDGAKDGKGGKAAKANATKLVRQLLAHPLSGFCNWLRTLEEAILPSMNSQECNATLLVSNTGAERWVALSLSSGGAQCGVRGNAQGHRGPVWPLRPHQECPAAAQVRRLPQARRLLSLCHANIVFTPYSAQAPACHAASIVSGMEQQLELKNDREGPVSCTPAAHRGFAFVDFASKQEAQAALEAVAGTHLYGRRLVVEWASEVSACHSTSNLL